MAGGTSYRKLAEKYGVSLTAIKRRGKLEGWKEKRDDAGHKIDTKVIQKTSDAAAQNAVKLEEARGLAIDWILSVLRRAPIENGSQNKQFWEDENGVQHSIIYDLGLTINALVKLSGGLPDSQKGPTGENRVALANLLASAQPARDLSAVMNEQEGEDD